MDGRIVGWRGGVGEGVFESRMGDCLKRRFNERFEQ